MKLLSMAICRWMQDTPEPVILHQSFEVSEYGFFQRSGVKQMLTFTSRLLIKRTAPGQRQTVEHEGHFCFLYMRKDGLGGVIIGDEEYPERVAYTILNKLLGEFEAAHGDWAKQSTDMKCPFEPLDKAIVDYQDPTKADKISKIQKDLDDTMEIMHKTIDNVLERGAKLDALVEKSNDLSSQSKVFYKTAKKANSRCCVIS